MTYPVIIGILFSILCFGLLYWYLGILNYYLLQTFGTMLASAKGNTSKIDSEHKAMGVLFWMYLAGYISIIKKLILIIFEIYILSIIKEQIGKRTFQILILSIIFFIIWYCNYSFNFLALELLVIFIGIIIILSITYFIFDKKSDEKIDLLLISSMAIMLITPIGSDTGLFKSAYGMWLALPLSLLCICKVKPYIKNTRISSMSSLVPIFLIYLLCVSVVLHITNNYRDDRNRLNLDTEFSDPSLKGIYSTSIRVGFVDELISQIKKNSHKGDEILILNNIPIFYYLTETKPAFRDMWLGTMPLEEIKEKQRELENKNELPKLFIYSKFDAQSGKWPNSMINIVGTVEKYKYLKTEYINNLNYSLLLENKAIVIYGRPSNN